MEAAVLNHNQAAMKVLEKEAIMVTAVHTKVRLLNRLQWVSWVEQGFNLPLPTKLPTSFTFMPVAPNLYTPAQCFSQPPVTYTPITALNTNIVRSPLNEITN
jgi:hypothetical protein